MENNWPTFAVDLGAIDGKLSLGKALSARQAQRLDTIRTIYEQQKYMYDHHTHHVSDRIVSVSQHFIRPIVCGKAGKPVEFDAKLDISAVDGWTWLECCSFVYVFFRLSENIGLCSVDII